MGKKSNFTLTNQPLIQNIAGENARACDMSLKRQVKVECASNIQTFGEEPKDSVLSQNSEGTGII
jgi:hypothetical protein